MPIRRYSRDSYSAIFKDDLGREYTEPRPRFLYRSYDDNIRHVVRQNEHYWYIAAKYYEGLSREPYFEFSPGQLWWVIADFQPTPVHDPTLALAPNTIVIVPSLRVVQAEIFNENVRLRQL